MADRLLLKGGHVLTMDPDLGDLTDTVIIGGKVHKRDGRLTADLSGPRALSEASKEHLIDASAQRQAESA